MTTASIALILPLADAQKSRRTGAKATNLSKLVATRFAVPRGFVLSADAYRSHLWASGSRAAASVQVDAEQREAIREAILSQPIPDDIWQSVAKAYERLSWQTGIPEPRVAVRSSAMEGGSEFGYPGAYESYLNVSGLEALAMAIKRVWASLWSGKAAAYRIRHECTAEPAMAVIVQQMVEGDFRGASCTANPVTGDPRSVSITVRGEESSSQYTVALSDLSVTKSADCPEDSASESVIRQIAEQSILAEDVIGGRVEIEWAVDRDGIWMLQAGSMADLPPYFPTGSVDETCDQVVWSPVDLQPISHMARGLVAGAPGSKVLNGYLCFSRGASGEPGDKGGEARARSKDIDEASESLRDWQKRTCPESMDRLKELTDIKATGLGYDDLLAKLASAAEAYRSAYHWMCRSRGSATRLWGMLSELVEDRSLAWRLLGGVPNALFERDALLQEMAERFAMAEQSGKLDDEKWWRSYKAGVERFALSNGYAFKNPGEAADPSRWKSWIEDTDPVFRMIGAISRKGGGTTLVTRHCAAEQDVQAAEADALKAIQSGKHSSLKRLIELCRGWIGARADTETQCSLAGSLLRLLAVELARRLQAAGALSSIEDVFVLRVEELTAVPERPTVEQRNELAAKIARRKHEMWLEHRLVAPQAQPTRDHSPEGDAIVGVPASPGSVTGRARMVTSVEDAADIERGDILVVSSSGSVWAPFFAVAAGFVCETGDEMAPEAVAARSYGIPAAMNCMGVTGLIRDGQKITVNGKTGAVMT